MTPASAALKVPPLAEPGEGWAKGGPANQQSAVFLGVPKGNRTVVQVAEWPAIPFAVVARARNQYSRNSASPANAPEKRAPARTASQNALADLGRTEVSPTHLALGRWVSHAAGGAA